MTDHLSPEEFVDALDGRLDRVRAAHLDVCAPCRGQHAELSALAASVEASGPVPEPSPFFLAQLSQRVRAQTTGAEGSPEAWWSLRGVWRPLIGVTAVAAALALAVVLRTPARLEPSGVVGSIETTSGASAAAGDDRVQWDLMVQTAATLSPDDVYQVASSVSPDNELLIDDLTPAERATFVHLLDSEMGGTQ